MRSQRKIAVVTTARSEYGLLSTLIRLIHEDDDLELILLVGGSHMSSEHGLTVNEVRASGVPITETVDFLLSGYSSVSVGKSMGLATISFVGTLNSHRPDILVLLGDRYETLAIAMAAVALKIPIAHIHGGEVSFGAIDDSIRHAISKLSSLHFTATKAAKRRVCQMGEVPEHVHHVGAPALDTIADLELASKDNLSKQLGIQFSSVNMLCTFHPVTRSPDHGMNALKNMLCALEKYPDASLIFTMPNVDEGSQSIADLVKAFVAQSKKAYFFESLGHRDYLSLVRCVDVVIGNSSSGLIEVPFMRRPSVNIGKRQAGRECASSVISCDETAGGIAKAIDTALSPAFQGSMAQVQSPYGRGGASMRIKEMLKSTSLEGILNQPFVDMRFDAERICDR